MRALFEFRAGWNGAASGSSDTTSHEATTAAALTQPILHLWVRFGQERLLKRGHGSPQACIPGVSGCCDGVRRTQVNSAMPCGTLRASLPQFLHSAPAGPRRVSHTSDWVLTKPGVRCEPHTLSCSLRAGVLHRNLQLRSADMMRFCKQHRHGQPQGRLASCIDLNPAAVAAAERDASARSGVSTVAGLDRRRHAGRHACRPVLCSQLLTRWRRDISWFLLCVLLRLRVSRS